MALARVVSEQAICERIYRNTNVAVKALKKKYEKVYGRKSFAKHAITRRVKDQY